MKEPTVPQPTETGWYAGPWPDEVYYLSDEGEWGTSFTRKEDTSHIEKRRLFTEDPRIARIEALCDKAEQQERDFIKDVWPERQVHNPMVYVAQVRAILAGGDA